MQEVEDISGRGIASGQRENRSTKVNKYRQPSDLGRGPTKSIYRLPNLLVAVGYIITADLVCLPTLDC